MGKSASTEKEQARAALWANALLLPGAGSILLGRRAGWAQAAIALVGFAVSLMWTVGVVRQWMAGGLAAVVPPPHLDTAFTGLGLFAVSWVWGMLTAWQAVRRAQR